MFTRFLERSLYLYNKGFIHLCTHFHLWNIDFLLYIIPISLISFSDVLVFIKFSLPYFRRSKCKRSYVTDLLSKSVYIRLMPQRSLYLYNKGFIHLCTHFHLWNIDFLLYIIPISLISFSDVLVFIKFSLPWFRRSKCKRSYVNDLLSRSVYIRLLPQSHLQVKPSSIYTFESHITLDPRLPFPDSVWGIFSWSSHYSKKSIRVLNGFPSSWRGYNDWQFWACWLRWMPITLTGNWHSRRLAALSLSIMLRNSILTEGKNRHISVLWMWWLTKVMFQLLNTTVK